MILPCTCVHPFQDAEYGPHQRVHNPTTKDHHVNGHRCTVCGSVKGVVGAAESKASTKAAKTKNRNK